MLPRLCAVAEVGWISSEDKDLESLKNRILRHRRRWQVMGLYSHPVGWVEVSYDHPDCKRSKVSELEVVFRICNAADEPAVVTGSPEEASGIRMVPSELKVTVGPGGTETVSVTFTKESGWDVEHPCPFQMNWQSVFGEVSEEWSLNIAPEMRFRIPEGRPDGSLAFWYDRMPFAVSSQARFGLCRTEKTIYCGVYVQKDVLYLDPKKRSFEQDGVEIRFDLRSDRDRFFSDGEIEFRDLFAICVSPGSPKTQHGAFYRKNDLPREVQTLCRPVEGGYFTEAAMPCERDTVRVNVCVNLSDGEHIEKRCWRPPWRSKESFPWSGTFYFEKPSTGRTDV
jgi:hypothetical protein